MKTLVILAHPAFGKSRANKKMIENLPSKVEVVDLYEDYPEFNIDIEKEQFLVNEHDCVVFQYPLFWYSVPSLLKEWIDIVFEHGFAFGRESSVLQNKLFFNAITTGAPQNVYCADGVAGYDLHQILTPMHCMANLCQMTYLPHLELFDVPRCSDKDLGNHSKMYSKILEIFANNELDEIGKMRSFNTMNEYMAQRGVK